MPAATSKPPTLRERWAGRAVQQIARKGVASRRLLVGLAQTPPEGRVAVVGMLHPRTLAAVGRVTRRRFGLGRKEARWCVVCFHWPIAARLVRRALPTRGAEKTLLQTVSFCVSQEGRTAWTQFVERELDGGGMPFGMVIHTGATVATDIRGDLNCLLPLMTDSTLVVLMNLHRPGPLGALRSMLRKGWHAVRVGPTCGVAVLQMPETRVERTKPNAHQPL